MPLDLVDHQQDFATIVAQAHQAREAGEVTQALELFQQAITLASNEGEKAEALSMVGRCYGTMGDFEAADEALVEALHMAVDFPLALARAKSQLGIVRWAQGRLDEAKQFLFQAVAELRRLGDQPARLRTLSNLGLVVYTRGEYQAAIDTYKAALDLAESMSTWYSVAINLNNLGECYQDLGDLKRAQELHERALLVARERDAGEYSQIDVLRNLGVDLLGQGEVDRGLDFVEQSLAMARAYHQRDLELQGMISLGGVHLAKGECGKAEEVARQLIDASAGVPNRLAAARLLLGRCYLARGDEGQAVVVWETGLIDAQASYSKILILRLHAALSQIVSHEAIAQVHRRIAAELVEQIADSLEDKALQAIFLQSPLARSVE